MMKSLLPITIVARKTGLGIVEAKHRLLAYLDQNDLPYQLDNHERTLDGLDTSQPLQLCDLKDVQTGILISLGGDGSLLRLVEHAVNYALPLVGINLGRVGFLTDLTMDNLASLKQLIEGHHIIDRRPLLEVFNVENDQEHSLGVALNEVLIKGDKPGKTLTFTVSINHESTFQHYADGFLVSTATGSTAYALSAGGPIIVPELDVHLLTPICPHKLNTRPVVTASHTVTSIQMGAIDNRPASLCIDGYKIATLAANSRVVVRKAKRELILIHPEKFDFMTSTRQKIHWESN